MVVVAVLASMTLLPAMLGLCGDGSSACASAGTAVRPSGESRFWHRWGQRLARRPGVFAVASIVLLADRRNSGDEARARPDRQLERSEGHDHPPGVRPDDRLVRPGLERPADRDRRPRLEEGHRPGRRARRQAPQGLAKADGVQAVSEPQISKDGTAAMINVVPKGSPTSDVTKDLVSEVRDSVIPDVRCRGQRRWLHGSAARPRRPDRRAAPADHRGGRRAQHAAAPDRVPVGRRAPAGGVRESARGRRGATAS